MSAKVASRFILSAGRPRGRKHRSVYTTATDEELRAMVQRKWLAGWEQLEVTDQDTGLLLAEIGQGSNGRRTLWIADS